MSKVPYIQTNFNGGELSPYLLGRTDLDKYFTGAEKLHNYIPLIQGGLIRRPGFRYIVDAMGPSRLIPFVFNLTQAYILEFGNKRIRFYTNGGQIQSGG